MFTSGPEFFDDIEEASQNLFPVMFGSQLETLGELARVDCSRLGRAPVRAGEIARHRIPRAARVMPQIDIACREVAGMLSDRLGLPALRPGARDRHRRALGRQG